jgi:hypothetical protein
MKPTKSTDINPEEIALSAYLLWEKDGRPEGRDLHFWLEAEKKLTATKAAVDVGNKTSNAVQAAAPLAVRAQPDSAEAVAATGKPQSKARPASKRRTPVRKSKA